MGDVSTCERCSASPLVVADDGGCERCGALPGARSAAEALRQERAVAWALQQVLDAEDAAGAADALKAKSALRMRLLGASVPPAPTGADPEASATTTPVAQPAVDDALADEATPPEGTASLEAPTPTPEAPTKKPTTRPSTLEGVGIGAPVQTRRPVRAQEPRQTPPRPPPREPPRVLSPAEARAQFERRLEIGGWFTGALFAVGGSLWATNLFWNDIPAAFRPVVVGGGLAAFAAAFMALGAILATRHAQSLAGPVLGLVGRLIGVSATIPLAMLRQENLPLWLVTTAAIVVALGGGLRFAWRRRAVEAPDVFDATAYFLGGFVLAATGPGSAPIGVAIAVASLLVARAAVAAGTLPALAGQRTWVDDVSVVFVGIAGAFAAVFHARDALGQNVYAECYALACLGAVELVRRLIEQRPGLFGLRAPARWVFALWALGTAFSVVDDNASPLLAAAALLFVTVAMADPTGLGLPRFFSLLGIISASWAAAFLTRLVPWVGDVADAGAAIAGLAALLLLTTHHRRGSPDRGERVASFLVWCGAVVVALTVEHDVGRVLAAVLAALLFVTDRRSERSVAFALVTIPVSLLPVGLVLAETVPKRLVLSSTVAVLAVVAALLHALRLAAPARPLLPAVTAAVWWTVIAGTVTAFAAPDHVPALAALAVCAAALFVVQERSRQADVGVFAAAFAAVVVGVVVRDLAGWSSLRPGLSVAAVVLAGLSALPPSRLRHGPALARGWYRLGRARFARPWSAGVVALALVVVLLVLRVPMIPSESGATWHLSTALLVVAAGLLLWRAPSRARIMVAAGAVVVLGADAAAIVEATAPVVAMGFGGGLVALALAALAVPIHQKALTTCVLQRGVRRRRAGSSVADAIAAAAAAAAILSDLVALGGIADLHSAGDALLALSLWLSLVTLQALVLFASIPAGGLVALAVLSLASAPLSLALRSLLEGAEVPTLMAALTSVAVLAMALVLARTLYRRRAVPSMGRAWPPPWSLRTPALFMLLSLSWVLGLIGVGLHLDDAHDVASRYGPGVAIVGVALGAVAVLGWRTRRTFAVALLGGGAIALVGAGIDGIAHAAHWVPKSFGDSQALVALGLVAAAVLLDRDGGRRLLWGLRLGWPERVRRRLIGTLSTVVPLMVLFAAVLAVRDAPRAHELAIVLGGLALVGLGFGLPSPTTARGAAVGVVLVGSGLGALMARLGGAADLALEARALPAVALGGLLAAVAVQTLSARVWRSGVLADLHAVRFADDDALAGRCASAMRGAVESGGLLLLAVVVAVAIVDDRPAPVSLWSTWFAMGLALWLTSRMALEGGQTWPAALGQGVALAIYVDIRRRTPWLDGVDGVDVLACLAGAAVFILVGMASRRQPKGAGTARAAEIYAVTLPVIAAGLGDSDAGRAVICLVGGGLYALLSRTRRQAGYEFAAGVALVAATTLALSAQGVRDATLYLLPVAFVGTFLARRHRARLGPLGRSLAVWCHVPLYCASAWSALQTETFSAFALGVIVTTGGVIYAIRAKDRRSLYAAAAAAAVLVVGRLILLGLDNALLGTLLLAGAGVLLLAGMTVFTIRRDAASDAVKRATAGLDDWD